MNESDETLKTADSSLITGTNRINQKSSDYQELRG